MASLEVREELLSRCLVIDLSEAQCLPLFNHRLVSRDRDDAWRDFIPGTLVACSICNITMFYPRPISQTPHVKSRVYNSESCHVRVKNFHAWINATTCNKETSVNQTISDWQDEGPPEYLQCLICLSMASLEGHLCSEWTVTFQTCSSVLFHDVYV